MKEAVASKSFQRKISIGIAVAVITVLIVALAGAFYSSGDLSSPTATPTPPRLATTMPTVTPTPTPIPPPTSQPPILELPKPSIPEFTLKLIDSSYDVPTTYYMDTYGSGKNETRPGYHVEARNITVTIKNQPYASFVSDLQNLSLMFNIRTKAHDAENWTNVYRADDGFPQIDSGSENTIISFQGEYSPTKGLEFLGLTRPVGARMDFQVEAMIGNIGRVFNPNATNQLEMYPYRFIGEESGWSDSKTLTIPTNEPLISVLSPQQKNHVSSDIPLTFEVDRPVSQFKYSLDGQENVTISGNTTLANLSNGLHNITVYAWDLKGNVGASETIPFETEPSPAATPSLSTSPTQTGVTPFVGPPENKFSPLPLVFIAVAAIVIIMVIVVLWKIIAKKPNVQSINKGMGRLSAQIGFHQNSLTPKAGTMKPKVYRIIFFRLSQLVKQHRNSGHI